jgi:hypothetical protein
MERGNLPILRQFPLELNRKLWDWLVEQVGFPNLIPYEKLIIHLGTIDSGDRLLEVR